MSMDPVLLDACGDVLAAQFAGVTKVLTGEAFPVLTEFVQGTSFQGIFYSTTLVSNSPRSPGKIQF